MKLKLTETPEQVELFKAIGSKDKIKSMQAQEALAAFITKPIQQVLDALGTWGTIYSQSPFNSDEPATIPLDSMYGFGVDSVQVWSQSQAGGLATSEPYGIQEMPVATFDLMSAVAVSKKYAKRARLDVISRYLNRMAQELQVRIDLNAFNVLLKAAGEASTNGTKHSIAATSLGLLQVDDFNRLLTLNRRLNVAFNGGTPDSRYSNGVTDIFLSPEMVEQVRSFAYQPMNTRDGSLTTSGATSVPLPDSVRERIYNASGVVEIFGKVLHELLEFGVGQKYNALFAQYAQAGIVNGGGNFATGSDEIVLGLDLTRDAFISPIERSEDGATANLQVDDQFPARADKFGWVTSRNLGFVCLDSRAISLIVV